MFTLRAVVIGLVGAAVAGSAASAQTQEQTYGYNAIQRDDLAGAEARLIAQRLAEPNEPSVLINLAHIYSKTGRVEQAEALYRQIIANENILMLTGSRQQVWSHQLARRGLDRARMMASR